MKKTILLFFAAFGMNAAIAQSSLDKASGGYFNNNDVTPPPAGTHTVTADSAAGTDHSENRKGSKVNPRTNTGRKKSSKNASQDITKDPK